MIKRLKGIPPQFSRRHGETLGRMNESIPSIDELFSPLIGLPCWNVKHGHGSFLTFEFGNPGLTIHEPRDTPDTTPRVKESLTQRLVTVHGQWHLWVYCCGWRIQQHKKQYAHNESDDAKITAACSALDGQALTQVITPRTSWTQFHFDLGGMLTTGPYDDKCNEHWMLYCPGGCVYTYRSDGRVSFGSKDQTPDDKQWITTG